MDLKLFALLVFAIAVVTVGILQWLKGLWKTVPSLLLGLLLPVVCIGLGLLVGSVVSPVFGLWLLLGGLAWAVGQLCYELIVQSVPQLVGGLIKKVEDKVDTPPGG